jgi:hypothetical protein
MAMTRAAPERNAFFDRIYATDLRYVGECYKLCGDGACCNWQRYKQRWALPRKKNVQELPLLPGELDYLQDRGYLDQFQDHTIRRLDFQVAQGTIRYRAIISERTECACDHATRPTVCRLYPLFPRFEPSGALVAIERGTIFDELERIEQIPRACQLDAIPLGEIQTFVALASHIGSDPVVAFYMEAYRIATAAAAATIESTARSSGTSAFRALELLVLRAKLFDTQALRVQLEDLAARFATHHGDRFQLA